MDPGHEFGIVAGLVECPLERFPNAAFEVHPAHRGEAEQDLGPPGTGRRGRDGLLEQGDRTWGVAGVEVILRSVHAAPTDPFVVVERGELPGELRQSGGGVGRSSTARVTGRLLERRRHVGVGTGGRQREVARAFLVVGNHLRQAAVEAASGLR